MKCLSVIVAVCGMAQAIPVFQRRGDTPGKGAPQPTSISVTHQTEEVEESGNSTNEQTEEKREEKTIQLLRNNPQTPAKDAVKETPSTKEVTPESAGSIKDEETPKEAPSTNKAAPAKDAVKETPPTKEDTPVKDADKEAPSTNKAAPAKDAVKETPSTKEVTPERTGSIKDEETPKEAPVVKQEKKKGFVDQGKKKAATKKTNVTKKSALKKPKQILSEKPAPSYGSPQATGNQNTPFMKPMSKYDKGTKNYEQLPSDSTYEPMNSMSEGSYFESGPSYSYSSSSGPNSSQYFSSSQGGNQPAQNIPSGGSYSSYSYQSY
ncbi:hypothetical protein DSO57_1018094 [Entomophthora muscae]|uniref:Uncharacterized protein n=1 Tax=Entomophthora muscae TaxID=34485 RepID=A0ACC2TRQ3_9FUNG|nr:hypothetical protein DSO57_1018094 [Entomophthora muscae]